MFFNENKRKRLHNNRVKIPGGFGRGSNMSAVSLFRFSNMAAVTSLENREKPRIDLAKPKRGAPGLFIHEERNLGQECGSPLLR